MTEKKVTRLELIEHQQNDMCDNYFFLAHCRVYRADHKVFYKCHFVVWIDNEDVLCMLNDLNGKDNQTFTEKDARKCAREWADTFLFSQAPDDFEDREGRLRFSSLCNESIDLWNKGHRRR